MYDRMAFVIMVTTSDPLPGNQDLTKNLVNIPNSTGTRSDKQAHQLMPCLKHHFTGFFYQNYDRTTFI